jgi:hypothetical protein
MVSLEGDVGPEVVDLSLFSYSIDGRRRVLIQDSAGTSPNRRDTTICVLLRATCLFIDSYSLVGDGAFLNLAMVEVRRFFQFQRASRRRWSWAAADGFGSCRKP